MKPLGRQHALGGRHANKLPNTASAVAAHVAQVGVRDGVGEDLELLAAVGVPKEHARPLDASLALGQADRALALLDVRLSRADLRHVARADAGLHAGPRAPRLPGVLLGDGPDAELASRHLVDMELVDHDALAQVLDLEGAGPLARDLEERLFVVAQVDERRAHAVAGAASLTYTIDARPLALERHRRQVPPRSRRCSTRSPL